MGNGCEPTGTETRGDLRRSKGGTDCDGYGMVRNVNRRQETKNITAVAEMKMEAPG